MQVTMITPAQYKSQAQLIVYSFCKLQGLKPDRNAIFNVAVGGKEVTHYMHSMEVNQEFVNALMIEQKRTATGCPWAYSDLTSDTKVLSNSFAITLNSPKEVLKLLKAKVK